jgi:hypothetical protein
MKLFGAQLRALMLISRAKIQKRTGKGVLPNFKIGATTRWQMANVAMVRSTAVHLQAQLQLQSLWMKCARKNCALLVRVRVLERQQGFAESMKIQVQKNVQMVIWYVT